MKNKFIKLVIFLFLFILVFISIVIIKINIEQKKVLVNKNKEIVKTVYVKQDISLELYNISGIDKDDSIWRWSDKSKHILKTKFSFNEKNKDIFTQLYSLIDNPLSYKKLDIDLAVFPEIRLSLIDNNGNITDLYISRKDSFISIHDYKEPLNRDGYRIVNSGFYRDLQSEYDNLFKLIFKNIINQ
jgi:hypothetical protein